MANGAWIKLSVGWDEDERVALLPPLAQLTYLKVMTRAKRQRPQGGFGSLAHLKALLPDNLHKHLPTLVKAGLIFEQDGRMFVDNWGASNRFWEGKADDAQWGGSAYRHHWDRWNY